MVEMKSLKMAFWQLQVRFTTPPYIIRVHMLEIIICYNLSNLLIGTKKKKNKERKKTNKHIGELIEKHFRTICLLFIIHLQLQPKFMKV